MTGLDDIFLAGDWVAQDPWPKWFGWLTGSSQVEATHSRRYTCSIPLIEWAGLHHQHRRLPRTMFGDIAATFYDDATDPSLLFSLDALNPHEIHLHVALQTSTKGSVSFEFNGPEPAEPAPVCSTADRCYRPDGGVPVTGEDELNTDGLRFDIDMFAAGFKPTPNQLDRLRDACDEIDRLREDPNNLARDADVPVPLTVVESLKSPECRIYERPRTDPGPVATSDDDSWFSWSEPPRRTSWWRRGAYLRSERKL